MRRDKRIIITKYVFIKYAKKEENMQRRDFLLGAGGAALACAFPAMAKSTFPNRPITLYCPFTAGGATDQIMRLLATSMSKTLGQSVVIENKPGAGGTLPALTMRTAAPDGYTLTQVPIGMLRLPHMQAKKTFNPIEDFTFVCNVTGYTLGLVVPADSSFKSVHDVVAFAKANPGKLNYGSTGIAASPNLLLAEFTNLAGIDLTHVPYKGDADMLLALLGKQVELGTGTASFAPYVNNGQLRLLATYGGKRSEDWPEVPTLKELGYDVVSDSPWGIAGPKGMDPHVTEILATSIQAALQEPAVVDALKRFSQPAIYVPPQKYAAWAKEMYQQEKAMVDRMGLANSM